MRREGSLWLVVAIASLALLVTWTQIGSLRYELIDHDEATFMVMAQGVLRGHLPYIEAFDNKPPGLFYALAATMALFGQSLAATRLLGDLCILGATLCLLAVGRRYLPLWGATALAGIFASAHLVKVAQYTSAEVVANLPMAGALLLLLRARGTYRGVFAAGVLLSAATLVRTNLGVVAVAVGLLLLVAAWRPGWLGVKRWAVVALGWVGSYRFWCWWRPMRRKDRWRHCGRRRCRCRLPILAMGRVSAPWCWGTSARFGRWRWQARGRLCWCSGASRRAWCFQCGQSGLARRSGRTLSSCS
jgi:hypothetical protein